MVDKKYNFIARNAKQIVLSYLLHHRKQSVEFNALFTSCELDKSFSHYTSFIFNETLNSRLFKVLPPLMKRNNSIVELISRKALYESNILTHETSLSRLNKDCISNDDVAMIVTYKLMPAFLAQHKPITQTTTTNYVQTPQSLKLRSF